MKVTACKVGQATITVTTDNGLTASCLVTIPAPHYWLQAWQKNGMTAAFSFSEHPEVTLNDTKIVVTSGATVVEYQGSDFSHFTVVDNANDPTVVDVGSPQSGSASPRLSRHGSGWLVLTGCSPDTNVTVHNISGHLVATAKTDKQGGAELQLSKLGKGIFIIKIKETTFKITQR